MNSEIFNVKVLLVLVFLSITALSNGQKDLRKGYIIENSGDTIQGMINFQSDMQNSKECRFYFDLYQSKIFHPFEIRGYRFEGGKFYVSKYINEEGNSKKIFAEYLVQGKKDLFYFRDLDGFHYMMNKDESTLIEIPYSEQIATVDGKAYLFESTKHIGFLKVYFVDCPAIFDDIEKLKRPDMSPLITLTKKYNDIVCGENSCIVYRKKKLQVKVGLEPKFEVINFRDDSFYSSQIGGLVNFWLPQSNENLFLKTGLLYGKYTSNFAMYKIPLQFEYVFPAVSIKPKFDVGLNLYGFKHIKRFEFEPDSFERGLTFAAGGGVLIRATKNLNFDLYIETDILQFKYAQSLFYSHTIGIGILFLL